MISEDFIMAEVYLENNIDIVTIIINDDYNLPN
jgi:hypothetical protein